MNEVIQNKIAAEIKQNLLARVNARMSELQISQKTLSERTGIAATNLSNILKGRVGMSQLIQIAHALDINVENNELEIETGYWIKRRTELKNYLLSKIKEGIGSGIYNQMRLINYTLNKFESDFQLQKESQHNLSSEEWHKIRVDSLKIITQMVYNTFALATKPILEPATVYRHRINTNFLFSLSKVYSGHAHFAIEEMALMSFSKTYGAEYFYSEIVASLFESETKKIVQDVIDAESGFVVWVNPYC